VNSVAYNVGKQNLSGRSQLYMCTFALIRLQCRALQQTCCQARMIAASHRQAWALLQAFLYESCLFVSRHVLLNSLGFWPPRLSSLGLSFCQAALVSVHPIRLREHSVCILQPVSSFAASVQSLIAHSGYLASSLHKTCGRQADTVSRNHSANRL